MTDKIILASGSPRRKELLEKAGFSFEVIPSRYEEEMEFRLPPQGLAKYISMRKARNVAESNPNALVIGADTFIVFDGHILGKPHTPERAFEMLRMLSGKKHSVITGFTLAHLESLKIISRAVETLVHFKTLSEEEIEGYVATKEPLDKAGAYAIQCLGAALVERIEGDFSNVVGLPVDEVAKLLKEEFGVEANRQ